MFSFASSALILKVIAEGVNR